jgi:hypothetical protein
MKTLDPIGLFRYLNPRASGLIVFKGGGGGASAEEVDASVAAGTEAVNSNTNAGFAEAETQLAETTAAVETVGSNVGTASETGTTNVGTGSFTTPVVEKQVVNPDGSLGTETVGGETVTYGGGTANVTDTVKGDTEQIIGGQTKTDDLINKRFDTFQPTTVVSQSIDTSDLAKADAMADGFATSAGNQEKILADTGAISTAVGTGFADVGQDLSNLSTGQTDIGNQITDLSGNMGTRFNTVDETLGTGFADVNTNIDSQFTAQNENLTELSSNILGGQTSLQEYLESMSDRADTYYGGLAEGQANIQSSVGGLQDNFGDFRKQYTDDTTLANQARADLANQVTGGFSQVRDDLDRNFDATSQQNATITRNTEQTMRNQDDMTTSFGAAFNQIGAGVEAQTTQQQAAKTDMLQRLNTIREVILAEGQNLDPALTMQYAKLADSFDADGRLIQQSTNSNGTVTQRGFDPNNNLNLATFNQQGQVVDRTRLNIDQLMSQMDQMGYSGSSNTGLMSGSQPFRSTVM